MLDSAHSPVAGPFPQITKRPVVGPDVPVMGPIIKSKGASGEKASNSRVKESYKMRAASDAPPRKSFSHFSGIRYSSVSPADKFILRMGCIICSQRRPRRWLVAKDGDQSVDDYNISFVTSCAQ